MPAPALALRCRVTAAHKDRLLGRPGRLSVADQLSIRRVLARAAGRADIVFAHNSGYDVDMTAVPLGELRDRLSEYVADVVRTHARVTITRHGHPAAVLISADDLASIEETLEILGTAGAAQAIREGRADAASGRFADNDEIKGRYGVA